MRRSWLRQSLDGRLGTGWGRIPNTLNLGLTNTLLKSYFCPTTKEHMAKDIYHENVRQALLKDGWVITHDPFRVQYGDADLSVDLGAEKVIAAEKGEEKIAVEVKSFVTKSLIYEFHEVLGQYLNYRRILRLTHQEDRNVILAIPSEAYDRLFRREFVQITLEEEKIKYFVFDTDKNEILSWKK